jgi:hypothetical protein
VKQTRQNQEEETQLKKAILEYDIKLEEAKVAAEEAKASTEEENAKRQLEILEAKCRLLELEARTGLNANVSSARVCNHLF